MEKLAGEEFARPRAFVVQSPPRSPVLANYGGKIGEFLAALAPASELLDLAEWRASKLRAPIMRPTPHL